MSTKSKNGYTLIELFIAIVVLSVIIGVIGLVVFVVKGANAVQHHGLKNSVTRVWEGPTNTPAQ